MHASIAKGFFFQLLFQQGGKPACTHITYYHTHYILTHMYSKLITYAQTNLSVLKLS